MTKDIFNEKRVTLNMILFSIGKLVSTFGTMIYTFAMGLYVLNMTGSSEKFAITLALGILPNIILSPLAGVWLTGVSKVKVAILVDVFNGLLMLLLWQTKTLNLTFIYGSTFLINTTMVFYGIATEVMKSQIVPQEAIGRINSISKLIDGVASVMAPFVGGVLVLMFPIKAFIVFNAVSFFISALSLLGVKSYENRVSIHETEKFWTQFKGGFRYIMGEDRLRNVLFLLIALNFYLGLAIEVPIPFLLNQVFKVSSESYGYVMAGFPVGMLVGVGLIERFKLHKALWILLKRMNFLMGCISLLMAVPLIWHLGTYTSPFYFVLLLGLGIAIALIDVPIMVFLQTEVPEILRSRVMGVVSSTVKVALPLAFVCSGLLINVFPTVWIMIIGSAVAFISQYCIKI